MTTTHNAPSSEENKISDPDEMINFHHTCPSERKIPTGQITEWITVVTMETEEIPGLWT